MSDFPFVLKQLRKSAKMTQPELAQKLGISRSAISMYELGSREPDFETMEAIADLFNVDMNALMGKAPNKKGERLISADDFTYAMHNEAKNLPQAKKDMLLKMAKMFNDELEQEKSGRDNT